MRLYRLLKRHTDWTVRQYADTLGRSERWVKKWRARFQAAPREGLQMFTRKTRQVVGSRITPLVRDAILNLREELTQRYRRPGGARRILYFLHLDEALKHAGVFIPRGARTIHRVLQDAGRIPVRHPYVRCPLELPPPMTEWEFDFGLMQLGDGSSFEFMPVIDRGTSYLVDAQALPRYHANTVLQAIAALFVARGLPQRLRFDNDTRMVGSWSADGFPSAFMQFLWCLGVEPVLCDPGKPWQKPFVERVIGTIQHESFPNPRPPDFEAALTCLQAMVPDYNWERPHQGRACGNRPPAIAFPDLPELPQVPTSVAPDAWLSHYHGQTFRRRVSANGSVQVDKHFYYIGLKYVKQAVVLHLDAHHQCLHVTCGAERVKTLPIKGLFHGALDFRRYVLRMSEEARSLERHLHAQHRRLS
jgi:transposase InsO family protein